MTYKEDEKCQGDRQDPDHGQLLLAPTPATRGGRARGRRTLRGRRRGRPLLSRSSPGRYVTGGEIIADGGKRCGYGGVLKKNYFSFL